MRFRSPVPTSWTRSADGTDGTARDSGRRHTAVAALRRAVLGAALLLATGPPSAATGQAGAPPRPDSVVREEFARICRAARAGSQSDYGRGPRDLLQQRLESGSLGPTEKLEALGLLGKELLKQGQAPEAIATFDQALSLAAELGLPARGVSWLTFELALAHLLAAKQDNSVPRPNGASYIVPFRQEAIHRRPEHGRRAGDLFLSLLQADPNSVTAAWLLNLARQMTGDYPDGVPETVRLPPETFVSEMPFPLWQDRAVELGVSAWDLAGGAVMDDFDGDGLLDLVSSTWDPCGSLKAFRNLGTGSFEDVTTAWGLDTQLGGLNLVQADYDNDGRIDLLVLRGGWMHADGHVRNSLLRNRLGEPGGRFVDVTRAAGIAEPAAPTQTGGWADYDGDGDLDLYIGNETSADSPYPSQLFRNNRDGTFTDVATAAGVTNDSYAKAVAWGDYDDDGDPDLYVSNIGPNRLYRNNGDGTFTDVAPDLGVTAPEGRSFAAWFFDWDNDGDLDLFVAAYDATVTAVALSYFGAEVDAGKPRIYRNDGGRFTPLGAEIGFDHALMPMAANYGDLDNDGWLDLYLGTGNPEYESLVPNVMYRNDGGRRFVDVTFAGGFGQLQKGHGIAFGDLDNDGDQDLFEQLGGFFPGDAFGNALFENPAPPGRWITLRLEGRKANRHGLGARIEVRVREGERPRSIHLLAGAGGAFGGSSLQQEIGLGAATAIDWIRIRWPGSGTDQTVRDLEMQHVYRIREGAERPERVELPRIRLGAER